MQSSVVPRGLIVTVIAGFISAIPALFLLFLLLYYVFRMWQRGRIIFPITVFYLSLLFWDIVQAIGWIVNIRWVHLGHIVAEDKVCLPQAVLQQLGGTGTAISIVGMSWCILHDYVIDSSPTMYRWAGAVGLGILSLCQVLDILIPNVLFHGARNYYGVAGYWCWISNEHFATKIVTEYLWFWSAWLFSFLTAMAYLYAVQYDVRLPAGFLWIGFPIQGDKLLRFGLFCSDPSNRGLPKWSFSLYATIPGRILTLMLPIPIQYFDHYTTDLTNVNMHAHDDGVVPDVDDTLSGGTQPHQAIEMTASSSGATSPRAITDLIDETHSDTKSNDSDDRRAGKRFALRLLLFPISYLVLIAPLSIVRFITFRQPNLYIAPGWTIFVASFFSLEGLVDVILFIGAGPAFGIDFSS